MLFKAFLFFALVLLARAVDEPKIDPETAPKLEVVELLPSHRKLTLHHMPEAHFEAEEFCRKSSDIANANDTSTPPNHVRSHLIAMQFHGQRDFILSKFFKNDDKMVVWTGGILAKTGERTGPHQAPQFMIWWTDRSTPGSQFINQKFFPLIDEMRIHDKLCVGLSLYSGFLHLYDCVEKKPFICLTIPREEKHQEHTYPPVTGHPATPTPAPGIPK